jgi:hypothetical protein
VKDVQVEEIYDLQKAIEGLEKAQCVALYRYLHHGAN